MLKRQYMLADRAGLGDADTMIKDIDYLKPVSAIDIIVRATTGAGAAATTPLARMISDISIVDGAFTLVGGIMSMLCALQWHRFKSMPVINYEVANSVINDASVRIFFGRYLGDKEYYLRPDMFSNLQLRITNAMTIAAGHYATGTCDVSVIAHVLEKGNLNHKGTYMTKQIVLPTLVATAESDYDLPTDHLYDGLLFCFSDGQTAIETVGSRIKVSIDADSIIPLDARLEHIHRQNMTDLGWMDIHNDIYLDQAPSILSGMGAGTVTLEFSSLFGGLYVPLGDGPNADWFDPTIHRSLKVFLTAGSAGGATRVVGQQVYRR